MTLSNAAPTSHALVEGTPLEDHRGAFGLLVKREDLSCSRPGPPFSKMRGVISHMRKQAEAGVKLFGALDTYHSQAGHAVSYGARLLGAECVNYFPMYKADIDPSLSTPEQIVLKAFRPPQLRSSELGAQLHGLTAGRSAILYHQAKKDCLARGGYMMPNALKLPETVQETAAEVLRTFASASREEYQLLREVPWLISASSATIASGVLLGISQAVARGSMRKVILHLGYSRSHEEVLKYVAGRLGWDERTLSTIVTIVDEGYAYKDQARKGPDPLWPCNPYYDLKAFRWWMAEGREQHGRAVLWNIG